MDLRGQLVGRRGLKEAGKLSSRRPAGRRLLSVRCHVTQRGYTDQYGAASPVPTPPPGRQSNGGSKGRGGDLLR